jgi:queuine tRNA-ribosyltransferase
MEKPKKFDFKIEKRLEGALARTGVITTPHGQIKTPAFIPVGTKATLKALTPEQLSELGAQAVLVNAYHLYLQPGHSTIEQAGGVHQFMHWDKPVFSDSGGFQIMSLGVGFKKVIDMSSENQTTGPKKGRLAWIDNDGVTFKSHLSGDKHRFTPELAMQIQHSVGADIMFAFDELTTLHHSRSYQIESLEQRTHPWALASLAEHQRLSAVERTRSKPYQALFGVVQGAQYEDLRRQSARFLANLDFDGFGLGGAFTKKDLGTIVGWMSQELPENKPRHLLGISEPNDIFVAIENGVDTFDCVSPARVGRNGALQTPRGRINITNQKYNNDFSPVDESCDCYTCQNYTKAYLNHLFRAKELLAFTLATIHNERFIVKLVDDIRASIENNTFLSFKQDWLFSYYGSSKGEVRYTGE